MTGADLDGQVAVITGGAGTLGRAIASRLLRSGVRLALWDNDGSALEQIGLDFRGAEIHECIVDVTDAAGVERAVDTTLSALGRLDILVNNAGILGPVSEMWRYDPGAWRRVIDINLTGAFHCIRAIVPHMVRQGHGRIVNVSSIQGKEGTPRSGAYAAAKAGLIAATKTLGKELAQSGITVNCVAPAAFAGTMADQLDPQRRADILALIPMGRFCSPDEVAAMIGWICSPDCSFTTGAVFDVSGGRSTY